MAIMHKGYRIQYERGAGYHWIHGGYCSTIEECKREIDDWHAEDFVEHTGSFIPDSPSLEPAWWEQR